MSLVVESSDEELGIQRYLLDLALQPLDSWHGYDHIEQLGGSALRYQLNSISYALALSQLTRTPAFTGYLAEAQRNAILKMCDKKVWGYWAIENLIGYGRWNPDPIELNNVMYTAYFGVMIGLYETLNSDRSISEDGALKLKWNDDTTFDYDFRRIAEAIRFNMLARPNSPQYPCEPHLIYPMCNTFAFNSLIMHDRLHHTSLTGDLVERVYDSYLNDGWLKKNGRFVSGRIENTKVPILPSSIAYDAVMSFWLHAAMPDLAKSTWALIRKKNLHPKQGNIKLWGQLWDRIDFGNYNLARGATFTRAMLMHSAREMGDEDVALALQHSIAERRKVKWRNGARRFSSISMMGNGIYAMARFGRASGMKDLILGDLPEVWKQGPILSQAAYPDVLVAKAVTDGKALSLVLKPGFEPVKTNIQISRLVPNHDYKVMGEGNSRTAVADANGELIIPVELNNRLELQIQPME